MSFIKTTIRLELVELEHGLEPCKEKKAGTHHPLVVLSDISLSTVGIYK